METAGQFPTYGKLQTIMYSIWEKCFPPLPASRPLLQIPLHWRETKFGQQFLFYNNVYNSVLIFHTKENLRILSHRSGWQHSYGLSFNDKR
ncbi:hypothetical protein T10_4814 [Trichinella papuae]|uniref:Uncharacterized protein n=1 Tax=Trichinella papuae TaxID=268474 RepID=A0A0V1N3D3_9BILA|nr:hypothetical protein T10_4814 [Trichinella papuae]